MLHLECSLNELEVREDLRVLGVVLVGTPGSPALLEFPCCAWEGAGFAWGDRKGGKEEKERRKGGPLLTTHRAGRNA